MTRADAIAFRSGRAATVHNFARPNLTSAAEHSGALVTFGSATGG